MATPSNTHPRLGGGVCLLCMTHAQMEESVFCLWCESIQCVIDAERTYYKAQKVYHAARDRYIFVKLEFQKAEEDKQPLEMTSDGCGTCAVCGSGLAPPNSCEFCETGKRLVDAEATYAVAYRVRTDARSAKIKAKNDCIEVSKARGQSVWAWPRPAAPLPMPILNLPPPRLPYP